MKTLLFSAFLGPLLLVASAQARSPEVVVTAFSPFGANRTSTAIPIGRALVKHLNENGVPARFCELPVIYGGAFDRMRQCIEGDSAIGPERPSARAPRLIFGLGTGQFCIRGDLEMRAQNWIGSDPDEAGIVVGDAIDRSGPEFVNLPFKPKSMIAGLSSSERNWIHLNNDPGNFVCNDYAYETTRFMQSSAPYARTQFAFLHVPSEDCLDILKDPELWSPLITKMILTSLGKRATTPLTVHFVAPPMPEPVSFSLPELDLPTPEIERPTFEPSLPTVVRQRN